MRRVVKGIHLSLMIGPGLPNPAPQVVVEALTSLQVNSGEDTSGFQLTFTLGKLSPLPTMLAAGYFDPMITRVIIVVTVGGMQQVLVDGIVTNQQMMPSNEPGQSTLTITGEDLSVIMDVVEMPFMRYPAMPEIGRVALILAKYAALGIVPVIIPPVFMTWPMPIDKIPTQTGTDLQYVKNLARKHGYVFYLEPGPTPRTTVAYWGPDIRALMPQPALNVNMDVHTNVESLSFSLNGLAKKIVVLTIFDPATNKIPYPVPVPNVSLVRPPLGARLTLPAKVEFPASISKFEPTKAMATALGIMTSTSDAVTGSGSLDVLRYGRVLRPRRLVGVRGAGVAYDGFYYVRSVTHDIKRGEYKQSFNLSRDGLIATTQKLAI